MTFAGVGFKLISEIQVCKLAKIFWNPTWILTTGCQNPLAPRVIYSQLGPNSPYFEFLANTLVVYTEIKSHHSLYKSSFLFPLSF